MRFIHIGPAPDEPDVFLREHVVMAAPFKIVPDYPNRASYVEWAAWQNFDDVEVLWRHARLNWGMTHAVVNWDLDSVASRTAFNLLDIGHVLGPWTMAGLMPNGGARWMTALLFSSVNDATMWHLAYGS